MDPEKQRQSMGELAELMYQDPELKPVIDKWTEEKFPGVHARIAATKTAEQARSEIEKSKQEWKQELEKERAQRAREAAINRIKADPALRIRDDEIAEVEKLMAERYIGTYEDAATLYRRSQELAQPRATRDYTMEVPGLGGAGGDETKWLEPAFRNLGDKSVLDRVTKRRAEQIMADFAAGRGDRWQN